MTLRPLDEKTGMPETLLAPMVPFQKKRGNSGAGCSQNMLLSGLGGFISPVPSLWTAVATPLGVTAPLPCSYIVNRRTFSGSGAPTADQA